MDQDLKPLVLLVCGVGRRYRIAGVSGPVGHSILGVSDVNCGGVTPTQTTSRHLHDGRTESVHIDLCRPRRRLVFLVGYLFSQQTTGKAPIEAIMPEASRMPLYRICNDPFVCLLELSGNQAENLKNAKGIRGMAEFLTTEEAAA